MEPQDDWQRIPPAQDPKVREWKVRGESDLDDGTYEAFPTRTYEITVRVFEMEDGGLWCGYARDNFGKWVGDAEVEFETWSAAAIWAVAEAIEAGYRKKLVFQMLAE